VLGQSGDAGVLWPSVGDAPIRFRGPNNAAVEPIALNATGVVAGKDGNGRVFVWSQATGARDITPSGYLWTSVSAISDSGHVVAYGLRAGTMRALRWTPAGVATVLPGTDAWATTTLPDGTAFGHTDNATTGQLRRWDVSK
jgi:hypothetical protein